MERQVVYHARGRQEELTHRNRVFRKGSPRRRENDFPFPWADTIIGLSKLTPELEAGEECKERPAKVTSRVVTTIQRDPPTTARSRTVECVLRHRFETVTNSDEWGVGWEGAAIWTPIKTRDVTKAFRRNAKHRMSIWGVSHFEKLAALCR